MRWSFTSNVTPTTTSGSDSPPRLTYSSILSRLSTTILTFLEAVEPHLQRHPYTNIKFVFRSSPYISTIFSHLSTTILTLLEAVEPNLQRHPYVNIRFGFHSSPYISHHLFPSFYRHFNFSQSGGALTPRSPLQQHRILIPLLALPNLRFFPDSLLPF